MSNDSSAAFLRSLLGGIKTVYVGGAPVVLPAGTTPSTRVNFASGVSAVYNATTGAIDMTVTAVATPSQYTTTVAAGVNHNVPTNGNTTLLLGGPSAAFSIGGFALAGDATPSPGSVIVVTNTTAYAMTLLHEDPGTAAQYQINTQSAQPVTFLPRQASIQLMYNGTSSQWELQAAPQISYTQITGDELSWSTNPIYTGTMATASAHVVCAAGNVMHVGRPSTWPSGVGLNAFPNAGGSTCTLEAINVSGGTQTLSSSVTDTFTIAVHQ